MEDKSKKIMEEGESLISKFSRDLSVVPASRATHYITGQQNSLREDAESEECVYAQDIRALAPTTTQDGYVVVRKNGNK